ncbi:MAG TPA: hypothetical protein VKG25_16490 [Bryobacteraceae bacterium]|nr:hypothetical protein [Bryobacteraceae bacterium]
MVLALDVLGWIAAGGGDVWASDLNGLCTFGTDLAEAMELGHGPGASPFQAGGGTLERGGILFDSHLVEGEAVVVIQAGVLAVILIFVPGDADVVDGGVDGPGAANAPLGDGDVLDEMEFEDSTRLERIDIILLELIKKGVILITEDDRSGGKAMLYGVL